MFNKIIITREFCRFVRKLIKSSYLVLHFRKNKIKCQLNQFIDFF